MQKTLVISLSSIFFTLPLLADVTSTEKEGFLLTKECLQKGEFTECPLEQLKKISGTNPIMLFQGTEAKTYILDISGIDKSKLDKVAFKNNIIVTGTLQSDNVTLKVSNIVQKPIYKEIRRSGVI
ncbi:MAG: hypothetical protein PHW18_07570 [Sulfuricurvum sp.]|uniref:hypothetical protein n=1 Tax=Sulfuricurvum sp. TaxID=2025608 RepID=UPI002620CFCE|nr:hypothetical protein [Sulfuricurvum sp.]MDD2829413.1 hypothetical protein [Sulfuricurvum sp.]MDD4948225.1 hypothetical protein [Sulfuricurvum sp.]